jgi:hypothetical protein
MSRHRINPELTRRPGVAVRPHSRPMNHATENQNGLIQINT